MVLIYISAYASIRTIALNYGIKPVICVFNKAMVLYKETKKNAMMLWDWKYESWDHKKNFFYQFKAHQSNLTVTGSVARGCWRKGWLAIMLLTQKPQLAAMAPLKIENFLHPKTLKRSHGFPPSQLSKSVFWRVHSVYGTNNMMSYSFLFLRLRRFIG